MSYYTGIDVSLEYSSVCVVDGAGKIIREQRIASEPEALIAWFRGLGFGLERIGLEAGPMSQWLHAAMRAAGLAVELLETRHVRDAFKAMPVKSDRNDARGIAQLMRLGWFRPVHCKSMAAQEMRALLTARKLVQSTAAVTVNAAPWRELLHVYRKLEQAPEYDALAAQQGARHVLNCLGSSDSFGGLRALLVPAERRQRGAVGRGRRKPTPFGMEIAGRWALARRGSCA